MILRWGACCVAISLSVAVGGSTFAHDKVDDDARSATAGCAEALKSIERVDSFEGGVCLGILKGLYYLSKDICIPPSTSLGQVGDVVARHLAAHPKKIREDFQETALDAMRTAWPCGQENKI
jgi:hypothetical protein